MFHSNQKNQMTVSEFQLAKVGYTFNCNTRKSGSHYKFLMTMGRIFPTTLSQAKYFVSQGVCLDVLNYQDVQIVESMLNKHGYSGDYKYTKSQTWVRLINSGDLIKALKSEYNF
jgi:hypothetical protein